MSFISTMFDAAIAGTSGNFAPWEEPSAQQNVASRTHHTVQGRMPEIRPEEPIGSEVIIPRCQHNDKEGVSPGDLAEHAVNMEISQGLNDVGIDVGGTVDAICEAQGNEVMRPDVEWGGP